MKNIFGTLFILFVIGVSGVFLLIGLLCARKTTYLQRRGIRTKASVVDFAEGGDGNSYPIVEFVDQSGTTYRGKLSVSGGSERRGNTTTILYDAENPTYLIGTTFVQSWLFPVGFIFMGGGGVLVGIAILFGGLPTE